MIKCILLNERRNQDNMWRRCSYPRGMLTLTLSGKSILSTCFNFRIDPHGCLWKPIDFLFFKIIAIITFAEHHQARNYVMTQGGIFKSDFADGGFLVAGPLRYCRRLVNTSCSTLFACCTGLTHMKFVC